MPDKIAFFSEKNKSSIHISRRVASKIAKEIFADYNKEIGFVNIIFCDDAYLLDINRTHLNHDYYTDIITFGYDVDSIQSDMYISTERVLENAHDLNISPIHELYSVIFHGCLHLCGLKDKTNAQIRDMRAAEAKYLARALEVIKEKAS